MSQTIEVRFKGTRKAYFLWEDAEAPLRVRDLDQAEPGHLRRLDNLVDNLGDAQDEGDEVVQLPKLAVPGRQCRRVPQGPPAASCPGRVEAATT